MSDSAIVTVSFFATLLILAGMVLIFIYKYDKED